MLLRDRREPAPGMFAGYARAARAVSIAVGAAMLAAVTCSGAFAQPAGSLADPYFGQDIVPGEVIVRYKDNISAARSGSALARVGAFFKRSLILPRTEVVAVTPGQERAVAAALERDPNVLFAEPNGIARAFATPNDARLSSLWGLNNNGQAIKGVAGVRDADIDALEGWNLGFGLVSNVIVADIDTGVIANHPDLAANMFTNPGETGGGKETNGIDDDGNGFIDDFRGWDFINNDNNPFDDNEHGTHVAGTIAGRANNTFGVAGVASFRTLAGQWGGPKILAIKVLNAAGNGSFSAIADGIAYAGLMNVKVANMSLGGGGTSAALDAAIAAKPNTLYVIAAGNDGLDVDVSPQTPCVPATLPDMPNKICVAATDNRDQLADFSNFGDVHVDLAAPGVSILSSVPFNVVFRDDFSTSLAGRWTVADAGQTGAPRWNRSNLFSTSPTFSITDSPGGTAGSPAQYVNNQNNWIRNLTAFNFSGQTGCSVFAQAKIDSDDTNDVFRVESATSAAGPFTTRFSFSSSGEGFLDPSLAAHDGASSVFIRFRMTTNGSVQDDGVYLDDVSVRCSSSPPNANTAYDFFNGTSMATPHVAGAAAFLFTLFPTATVAQIKNKLLRGVDKKPALNGRVLTGGRLNLYKAGAESSVAKVGSLLRWTAKRGQTNNVLVTKVGNTFRFTDAYSTSTTAIQSGSRIVPGATCTSINDNTVSCPATGITRIVLTGDDLNDALNASLISLPVTLDGGPGNDNLIGSKVADILTGGPGLDKFQGREGTDTINARNDDADLLFNCGESANDNDTVFADATPNDPITASAANCEVVNKQ